MAPPAQGTFTDPDDAAAASPIRLMLAVVACTFVVELLIMELVPEWDRGLTPLEGAMADAAMLCLIMVPVLQLAVYRPMRAAIRRLEAALERLRLAGEVFEKSAEGILIADSRARILHVNPSFSVITGYSPEEALGQRTSLLKSGLHDAAFHAEMWQSLIHDGEWQGEIWNRKKSGEIYLESLSITRIDQGPGNEAHYVAIFTQANHDRLTGLANRHLFMTRLQSALESAAEADRAVGVLFIDLDGFKAVHDTLGHEQGDRLLHAVGRRLKQLMGTGQMAARLGGDEFAVLLAGPEARDEAARLADAIRDGIREAASASPGWRGISASIGIAVAEGSVRPEPLALLKAADDAMHAAKRAGKDRSVVATRRDLPEGRA